MHSIFKLRFLYMTILLVGYFEVHECAGRGMGHEARLFADLMQNYSKFCRPKMNFDEDMTVDISFAIKKIESLEEKDQVLNSFGWIIMGWHDDFLVWNPAQYGNVSGLVLPSEEVWVPEVMVYNSIEDGSDIGLRDEYRVQVYYNGRMVFAPGMKWRTTCRVDLRYFPFDTQTCNVSFSSWNYIQKVQYNTLGLSLIIYEKHDTWELINSTTNSYTTITSEVSTLPIFYFTVVLQRKSLYYVSAIIIPCLLVSLMSGMVFILPVDSGEKISLSITVSLSYTVLLLMMSEVTPRSGVSMPYLLNYLTVSMCQTTLSLVMTVIVLNIYHHSPTTRPPACLRALVIKCLGTLCCMCHLSKPSCRSKPRKDKVKPEQPLSIINGNGLLVDPGAKTSVPELPQRVVDYIDYLREKAQEQDRLDENMEEWRAMARVMDRVCLFLIIATTAAGIFGLFISLRT